MAESLTTTGDIDRQLSVLDLNTARYQAMSVLEATGGTYVALLARRCGVAVAPMMRLLERMTDAGLVELDPRPPPGRVRNVALTEFGRGLLTHAHRWLDDVDRRLLAQLSADDQTALARLLDACAIGLESEPVGPPDFD